MRVGQRAQVLHGAAEQRRQIGQTRRVRVQRLGVGQRRFAVHALEKTKKDNRQKTMARLKRGPAEYWRRFRETRPVHGRR